MPNNPNQAISEVREALEKGPTPGPWSAVLDETYHVTGPDGGRVSISTNLKGKHGLAGRRTGAEVAANTRLIAACNPSNITAILEDHDRLTKRVAELEEALGKIEQWSEFPPLPLLASRMEKKNELSSR